MKKLFYISALLLSATAQAQTVAWSAPLTVAISSFGNLHPRVQINGSNHPIVIWGDMASNAYFSRYAGTSFGAPVSLNPTGVMVATASWMGPDLGAHGDTVYAVMKGTPENTGRMYIVRSVDGGASWGTAVQIDAAADTMHRFPTVATDDMGNPIVGYMGFGPGFSNANWRAYRSMNYGSSFMPSVSTGGYSGGNACDCCPGSLVINGSVAAMLYRDELSNIRDMWAGISTDGGATFPAGYTVDNTNWMVMSCPSSGPDGVISGDSLYTVFMSGAVTPQRIFFSRSGISTMGLGAVQQLTPGYLATQSQNFPRMAGSGSSAAVIWRQGIPGGSMVCMSFTPDISAGFTDIDTVASGLINNADVAIRGNSIHVVWEDATSGSVMYRMGTVTPAAVNQLTDGTSITVSPVPANDVLNIQINKFTETLQVTITDLGGKVVYTGSIGQSGRLIIPIATLANGNYLLEVSNSKDAYTQKVVIQH